MLRNPCSRSCTSAPPELARLDGEKGGARRAACGDPRGHHPDAGGSPRSDQPNGHDRRVAWPLSGDRRLADELIVPERTRDEVQEPRPDHRVLLAEEALAGLAHRAYPQLVVKDEEGGRRAGQGVALAVQDHAHAAPVADALAQLRVPRRILGRVAAVRAEPDRLRAPFPNWRPRPINPNESRHAVRSQHESNVLARAARLMHRFGSEPGAKSAQV